jgi:hypothetical protein
MMRYVCAVVFITRQGRNAIEKAAALIAAWRGIWLLDGEPIVCHRTTIVPSGAHSVET